MRIVQSLFWTLITLTLFGAAFGAAARLARHRAGWRAVVLVWLVGALGVAGAITLRVAHVEQLTGFPPHSHLGLFIDFTGLTLVTFGFPVLVVARRASRTAALSARAAATRGAGWALVGALVVLVVTLALDLAGVPFVLV